MHQHLILPFQLSFNGCQMLLLPLSLPGPLFLLILSLLLFPLQCTLFQCKLLFSHSISIFIFCSKTRIPVSRALFSFPFHSSLDFLFADSPILSIDRLCISNPFSASKATLLAFSFAEFACSKLAVSKSSISSSKSLSISVISGDIPLALSSSLFFYFLFSKRYWNRSLVDLWFVPNTGHSIKFNVSAIIFHLSPLSALPALVNQISEFNTSRSKISSWALVHLNRFLKNNFKNR